jgi:hypothetical protein
MAKASGSRARAAFIAFCAGVLGSACAPADPGGGTAAEVAGTGGAAMGAGAGGRPSGGTGGASAGTGGASAGTGGMAAAGGSGGEAAGGAGPGGSGGGSGAGGATSAADAAGSETAPATPGMGPNVDRSDNKERAFTFKASEADPGATRLLGTQQAFVDTRVAPLGLLVVHLHGSGEKVVCGYTDHGKLLASWGFHVFMPCYDAAVSWNNGGCGGGVGTCRLEMLDGTNHSDKLNVGPSESVEGRIVKALLHLQKTDPKGDWGYFLDGDKPRWSRIIVSGQSFGATSSLLIAKHRPVARAVGLSGPLDGGAAWLKEPSMTPIDRMYAFTHVSDGQHPTHKASMGALGLPGGFVEVEKSMPPYDNSHRLVGGMTMFGGARVDGHNATEARMQSPKDAASGKYVYEPVWRYLYGLPPAP